MDRYEFENLISEYIEGTIPFKKGIEFEKYIEENKDAQRLVDKVRNTIKLMKNTEKIQVSPKFNKRLLKRLESVKSFEKNDNNTILGFTPFYGSLFLSLSIVLIVLTIQLFYPLDSNSQLGNTINDIAKVKNKNNIIVEDQNSQSNNLADIESDSLQTNEKKLGPKNSNKIKFVNY